MGTLVKANQSWGFWVASWLDRECFWAWHVYERFLWTGLFRALDGDLKRAVERNGRGVYTGMFWGFRGWCCLMMGWLPTCGAGEICGFVCIL